MTALVQASPARVFRKRGMRTLLELWACASERITHLQYRAGTAAALACVAPEAAFKAPLACQGPQALITQHCAGGAGAVRGGPKVEGAKSAPSRRGLPRIGRN